jgi:sec-independent protein translocase protein TatC
LSERPLFEESAGAGDGAAPAARKTMGFFDHLEDLRMTIIKCVVVFGVFVAVIACWIDDFARVLNRPLLQAQAAYPQLKTDLVTNSPMGVFTVVIDICLIGGLLLALPFMLYFIGQFVAPALSAREKKILLPSAVAALGLFLGGAAFGYFLLAPSTIRVAFELNQMMGYTVLWTADRYYSLMMWLVLGVGAAFEFPLLILLLVHLGLIQVATLRKYRRHAIVVMFITSAIVTPTPDPFNQTLFALPLIVLYEAAILVAAWLTRRRQTAVLEI